MFKCLLVALVMLFSTTSFSQNANGVHVSSYVKEKSPDFKSDHLICLGEGWKKIDFRIDTQIKDLKQVYPKLFSDLSEDQKTCFAPNEVPFGAQKTIDNILKLIDDGAKDQLVASVNEAGGLPISEKKNDCSSCQSSKNQKKEIEKLSDSIGDITLRNEDKTLGRKLLRAEVLVGGVEVAGMAALIALPKSITKWDEDWVDDSKRNLKRAWTQAPVWDKDEWAINYIGHPLAGAVYYNALRSQGASRLESFIFSSVQSTLWEYGWEAIAEQPSIQDLFVTPVVGSAIGELAHLATLRMSKGGFSLGEKILVTVINPAYVLNNGVGSKKKK